MAGILRKFLPLVPSIPKKKGDVVDAADDDKNSVEYSFALEYSGPPVSFDVPMAHPVDVKEIPFAATLAAASHFTNRPLPVIQPIVKSKSKPSTKKPPLVRSRTDGISNGNGVPCKRSNGVDVLSGLGSANGDDEYEYEPKLLNGRGSSAIMGCANEEDCRPKSPDGVGNSRRLELSDGCNDTHVSSGRLIVSELAYGNKEGAEGECQHYVDPNNSGRIGSDGDRCRRKSSDGVGKSGGLEVGNGCDSIQESLGILRNSELPDDNKAAATGEFQDCMNPNDPESIVSTITSSARMEFSNGDGSGPKSFEEMRNFSRSGMLNDCGRAHQSSEICGVSELPDDNNEDASGDLQDYMNPNNYEPVESDLTSRPNCSEIISCKEEEEKCINEAPRHAKGPSVVSFLDPESVVGGEEESELFESESSSPGRPQAVRPGKKGTCYRCMKGNRFTEKEVCIVCGAKYCSNCVLRAMGSMPEGRKCVPCIGQKINEARRKSLGKCSRMLKQLLPEEEVKQIMSAERVCNVNQLPPELVYVNGEPLSQKELSILQNCPNPPKKLQAGYYWYDNVSGFWGEEGHKPCQIISPELNVGGRIQRDASKGNAGVLINNREITKKELMALTLVGVKCSGTTHFWVSADGSYQEEGMNNVKGKIWGKSRAKLICAVLSLPTPPGTTGSIREEGSNVVPNNPEHKTLYKLLLVGHQKSGTSTIFKQAKIVYNVPFSEDERQNIKSMIQSSLYRYIGILLEGRERFEEESLIDKRGFVTDHGNPSADDAGRVDGKTVYSIGPNLKAFSDWLLGIMASGNLESIFPAATREYASFVEKLWKDAAIQATYSRRSELELLPRVAIYFLERAVEIARPDYEPSDMDILYAEGITSSRGLSSMEFVFPKSTQDGIEQTDNELDLLMRYQLIRVHPAILGGNCKWLEMFEEVDMVLFCVSLTAYDEFSEDSNGVIANKMMASKQLFESIVTHPTFEDKKFLLILNKFDLLEEKIDHVPLNRCEWFSDFNPIIGHNPTASNSRNTNPPLAHRAFQYIAVKFKRFFHSLTDKKLYVSLVTGLETDYVDEAFKYAREILKYDEEGTTIYPIHELSSASIEEASSSA